MEVLEITPDWGIELGTPECELKFANCDIGSAYAIRVHGCALHYTCGNCVHTFTRRVESQYRMFSNMNCMKCKRKFAKRDYFETLKL